MSAVETLQKMKAAGILWKVESNGIRLQGSANITPDLRKAMQETRPAIFNLIKKHPTEKQLTLLAELEQVTRQWIEIEEQERTGFPTRADLNAIDAHCNSLSIRAVEIWDTLIAENPDLLQDIKFLEV